MSIYTELRDAGVPLENHRSDLYARATPEAWRILRAWQSRGRHLMAAEFTDAIDGDAWIDIPLSFDPYWDKRMETKNPATA